MAINVAEELAGLKGMTVNELRARFAEVFGEQTRTRHKQWLVKRIIWRLQVLAEGDLSVRARRRAAELANDADLRVVPPRTGVLAADAARLIKAKPARIDGDPRLPMPEALITRQYKGQTLQVKVLANGFEYEGRRYRSLSAVAQAITGTHWNGHHFFRQQTNGGAA
jgi:hypothetical protein